MDSSIVGLIGVIVIVLIAEAVGLCLRRPLGVLLRADKGAERSDFWSAYARVVLLLVPAAFALISFPDSRRDPILALVDQIRWGLAGLLIALAVTGKALTWPHPANPIPHPLPPPVVPPFNAGPAR
jgi:hypothetical protein